MAIMKGDGFLRFSTMATEVSNELMAKQASTVDSLAAGEYADSTDKNKQKVFEEGDDGYSSSDESIISLDGSESDWRPYNWPPKEPEWDVDSYDEYEFKINPQIRKLHPSQEHYDNYYEKRLQSFKSKGFLPDHSCGIYDVYLEGGPTPYHKTLRDMVADLANVCVKKFNETKNKTLELVNVVRATDSSGAEWKYYITFMAREYPNGPLVEYQAKVIEYLGDVVKPPFPIFCRPSPKPEI